MTDVRERLTEALAGRYRVNRELGRGGMAVVYLAEDLRHGRNVALKVLNPELGHEMGVDRFLREIRTSAGLSHPNILPLFDSGEADGLLYFVMPYVEGETLRQRLSREGPLPVDEVVRIVGEIAGALARAHEAGVVHRDVKPENILLESGHALVADFGVARALDAAGSERLTRTGFVIGTPAYMSPEQAGGEYEGDARSDVYALGCVAYEMLAGEPPFTGSSQAIVAGHLARPIPPLRDRRPEVPAGVQEAIERALAKAPSERYDAPTGLSERLRDAITVRARAAEARRDSRRRWTARTVAVAATASLAFGGWWLAERAARPAIERIAVLPASNLTRDTAQAYFVDGVHEALVGELQRAGVSVIARQSVLRFRGSEQPIAQIAEELGVDALLLPGVGREGDTVVVDVSLYDRRSDFPVWTASFTEPMVGVLGLYRDVSRRIAEEIGAVLSPEAETRLAERPRLDPQVYDAYLRGLYHHSLFTPYGFDLSQQHLENAIALDSTYAPAYLALALTWGSRSQANLIASDSARRVMEPLLERARSLDPGLVERHFLTPGITIWGEWRWEEGYAQYRRALELDPDNAETHAFYAQALLFHGHWEESELHRLRSVELDPLNPFILGMSGSQLALSGHAEEAVAALEGLFRMNPAAGLGESALRDALVQLGRYEEAFRIARDFHEGRGDAETVAALDAGYEAGGAHEGFGRAADVLAGRGDLGPVRIAAYYTIAGRHEEAIDWVERSIEVRDGNTVVMGILPTLWPLHDDPRFRAAIEGIGLPLLQGEGGE